MTLEQTAAGSQLGADLDAMIKKHEVEIKKLHEEMEEAAKAKDEDWQKELYGELRRLERDMKRATKSKGYLNRRPYVPVFLTCARPH
jgi:Skp family chaperone for outer membrane proteins